MVVLGCIEIRFVVYLNYWPKNLDNFFGNHGFRFLLRFLLGLLLGLLFVWDVSTSPGPLSLFEIGKGAEPVTLLLLL